MENKNKPIMDEGFRDSIGTITEEGKRNWIYAQKPSGPLYNLRTLFSIGYLVVFFGLPFIKFQDEPLFLFNVLERRFILFGVGFWPQDFFIFGIGMLTFILFVVLFTVVYGRVFCGWACPQTIFMEMVFRKIEYWIEGDASHQKALKKAPWNKEKILKRGSKHLIFFSISFLIANTFLAYIIGKDELFKIISEPVSMHIGGLVILLIFTTVFFLVYSWFREQVCLIVCPYGRLQAVMTDKSSILVAYDYLRGEPRSKFKKEQTSKVGDCIDCHQCVKVCPMGIDIRNGSQLECTACTACIDACDHIMESIHKPKGLIKYASETGIAEGKNLTITPRMIAYSVVLTILIGVLVTLLATRKSVDATILRTPGMLFQQQPENKISNLYNLKLINKTHKDVPVYLRIEEGGIGEIRMVGKELVVGHESKAETEFFILIPKSQIKERKTILSIGVYSGEKKLETIQTSFLGPISN